MEGWAIAFIVALLVIVFAICLTAFTRIRKCPSDKVMVIYGKLGKDKNGKELSAVCIHGGAKFIWPIIQQYQFLDLTPISISVDLKNALAKGNVRINMLGRFTVGISTEPGVMQNAAERLLGLRMQEVQELARDIIFGQMRLVIASMDIEQINTDRDIFLGEVRRNIEAELKKIGLRLINVNLTDINDDSGYLDSLAQKAAADAIFNAKLYVAKKNRDAEIAEAAINLDVLERIAALLKTLPEEELKKHGILLTQKDEEDTKD